MRARVDDDDALAWPCAVVPAHVVTVSPAHPRAHSCSGLRLLAGRGRETKRSQLRNSAAEQFSRSRHFATSPVAARQCQKRVRRVRFLSEPFVLRTPSTPIYTSPSLFRSISISLAHRLHTVPGLRDSRSLQFVKEQAKADKESCARELAPLLGGQAHRRPPP